MAQIYNTELFKELKDGIKLQQLNDVVPSQLADKVVPVMEVNPKLLRVVNIIKQAQGTSTGNISPYTTPTDKDFYLTGYQATLQKDVASDLADSAITVVIDNVTLYLHYWKLISLTATTVTATRDFTFPIKLDRGSVINITGAFTVGACSRGMSITGYTVDNIRA